MDLQGYLDAVRAALPAVPGIAGTPYDDTLLAAGLRRALGAYEAAGRPVSSEIAVETAGRSLSLASLAGEIAELLLVAWPWDPAGDRPVAECVARWHWLDPQSIWVDEGCPQPGDSILICYRPRHTIEGLDGALASTAPAEHEALLVEGAAAWAAELRWGALVEAPGGPTAGQVQELATWAGRRLAEYRQALAGLASTAGIVRPAWGAIGL